MWVFHIALAKNIGFGDSDKPHDLSEYTLPRVLDDLRSIIQILDPDKLILIGHGLGGLIGWLFVDRYPELVHKFVSIATPHPQITVDRINKNWANIKKYK